MKCALPYVALEALMVLACEAAPPGNRVAAPAATTAEPVVAATEPVAEAPAPPGRRGYRLNGDQIIADTFEVRHKLRDDRLTLVLHTDLGDDTEVFVSVARAYREPENAEEYIIEYFNEAGTVGTWRAGKTIDLAATDFWAEVARLQQAMASSGEPFEVASVADELRVVFTVYPSQKKPFAKGNANLTGKVVTIRGDSRLIEKDIVVRYPLRERKPDDPAS